jgi:DNA-binding MarR family transcriptional regulator
MGELVRELEALGYLHRVPDPKDGRAKIIALTRKGREADAVGVRAVVNTERRWARQLGTERVKVFRAVLEQLTSAHRT